MNNVTLNRRRATKTLGGVAAIAALQSSVLRGGSPNQQLRIGVIGCGVRGKYLVGNLPPVARVVAICDCAKSRMQQTIQPSPDFAEVLDKFVANDAPTCRRYQDYRRMIDQESLDAVIIATPDHHHVFAAMLALDAGLDVYVEKPLSLTIREGRLLADKVKQTGRVLQVGSQQRTMAVNRYACEFIRDGGLGKITRVDMPNYPGPYISADYPAQRIPEGLDWDLFLGPVAIRPHHRRLWVKDEFKIDGLMWRGWDLYQDFSGHLVTNWGGHNVDMVQYALGTDDTGPVSVEPLQDINEQELRNDFQNKWFKKTPLPERRFSEDPRFTPVCMRYENGTELNFIPGIPTATFYGEKGVVEIHRNRFKCDRPGLMDNGPDESEAELWNGSGFVARPHLENWIDCIATRREPNAPVEVGHRTATICHLVSIVRQLHRSVQWNPVAENFNEDEAANAYLSRPRRPPFRLPV